MQDVIVHGIILLPAFPLPHEAAEVVVVVEDVSRADAASEIVGESRLGRKALVSGGSIAFAVRVPGDRVISNRIYSVRVHVDVDGSGKVEKGDLVSTQSHPVLTRGAGNSVRVPVRVV